MSYFDQDSCGPRGENATVDMSVCESGVAVIIKEQPNVNDTIVETIDGCSYFGYTVYVCVGNH